jgi:predicted RNA binding protein YcfA (HicA-like mRNA interferase family)
MKYTELEKLIEENTNCVFYKNGRRHPIWKNPETGEIFAMSYHKSQEVATGTLNGILKSAGIKK